MGKYGFEKVGVCSIDTALGNPLINAERICSEMDRISKKEKGLSIVVFPELCLTGYSCGDLFLRQSLLDASLRGLAKICDYTGKLVCVGMPLRVGDKLYNCAVWIENNKVVGVVPKTYISNYNEFYEKRWFASASERTVSTITLLGNEVPFNENLIISVEGTDIKIGTEICEDLWVTSSRSEVLCRLGATLIVNPSASTEVVGKSEYRRDLVRLQSARCRCAYAYISSGIGESSTDVVFSGHGIIADNGKIVAEGRNKSVVGVVDISRCVSDRLKYNSDAWVSDVNEKACEAVVHWSYIATLDILPDNIDRYPFVPSDKNKRIDRCNEVLNLQKAGLKQRLRATGIKDVVLGISGGLDSTLALVVCAEAFKELGYPLSNIHCISMPCFGTSDMTKGITRSLASEFGVGFEQIDIKEACEQHLTMLGHVLDNFDITYENVQARERTQILFDKANMLNALVIGTGDMSELALGWCTYNGDHMSNYAVNSGVPKTLVKFLIDTYADTRDKDLKALLKKICSIPISPELLPLDADGNIAQKTEESIGKYDLHDFFLYHFVRNGYSAEKIQVLAEKAFEGVAKPKEIMRTLNMFLERFRRQQFKRSCIPDGVKVGSVSLSPRGDWRMPSDLDILL